MAVDLKQALEELRKENNKRKFDQSVDLVMNLKGIDLKRDNISLIINVPHKIKDKKVCGFLTKKNDLVKTITKLEFQKFKDKAALRELVEEFDFFIAHASLMPSVAKTFGKALGPAGKMPSPQLGIVTQETPEVIQALLDKIGKSIKIRVKEASIKVSAGKESMKDEDIISNINAISKAVINGLPNKIENLKNVNIKLTMSKPVEVNVK